MSHTRNPSPPPFPSGRLAPGIPSPPHFPPGCLTSGNSIRSTFHLLRISHIRNPVPPPFPLGCLTSGNSVRLTFCLLRMSHIRNLAPPPFPSPGVLHFKFSSLRFQVLKITFLIKIGRHFLSGKPFSHLLCLKKKCFEISKESNFVILNNGIHGFGPCKNEPGFGGGPTYVTDRLID